MEKQFKFSIISSTMLASFITPFILSSINIAMPEIAKDLSLSPNEMAWLSISFLISSTVTVIPMGKVADKCGRVKIFKTGFIIFSILSFFCGIASNKKQLLLFRFFQGIGAGMIFSTAVAIVSSTFQKGERGKYLGLSVSSVYAGLTLGPFLGGIFTQQLGWRSIFLITFIISLFVIYLIQKNIKVEWKNKNIEINNKLVLFYVITMLLLIHAITNIIKNKLNFLISIIFFTLYIIAEVKSKTKFIDFKEIINNKLFLFSNLAAFFHYSATFSITFLLSLYFQYIKNLTPQSAGLILSSMPICMMLISPLTGKFSDKRNPCYFTSTGIILSIIGFSFFLFIEKINILIVILSLLIIGTGFAFFSSPNTNQAISSLPNLYYSTGTGILSTMRVFGQNISMSIINTIFYFYIPDKNLLTHKEFFHISFVLSILISIILLFLALYFSAKNSPTNLYFLPKKNKIY